MLVRLLEIYLSDARRQLNELNDRFIDEVGYASRPYVEDVLGAFSASLDVIQIVGEELAAVDDAAQEGPLNSETVTILSDSGEIQFVSASVTGLLGYTREELVGRVAFDLVHPDDQAEVEQHFESALSDSRRVAEVRYRYRHKDGSWRRVRTHLQCIHHPEHPGLVAHSYIDGASAA